MLKAIKRSSVLATLFTVLMLQPVGGRAQGTAGFEILRLQIYPRGSALAGGLIADAGHIESIFYNPAGLRAMERRTAAAGYMNYFLDIESGYLAYVEPRHFLGTWGFNINYTNYGTFDERSPTGEDLGTFSASDIALGLSYANNIFNKRTAIGGNGKLVYSSIENYTAFAIAFDLAAQYDLIPQRLRLGAGIFNLGWTAKAYVSYKDDLPLYYRIGIYGIPEGLPANLYFAITLYHEYADNYSLGNMSGSTMLDLFGDMYYSLGVEFMPVEALFLRVGYDTQGLDQKLGTRKDGFAGLSGGIGFDLTIVRVDFALASYGELGLVQRFSLSAVF